MAGAMAAGAAFGPWGAAAGAAIDLMGSSSGGAMAAPISSGLTSDNVFDSSGWTVATGGSKASGVPSSVGNPYLIGAALLAATLVVLVWLKK